MYQTVVRNLTLSLGAVLGLGLQSLSADKITLANGEVLEGEVMSETSTEYTIKVKIGGVRDVRTYPKIEVKNIERKRADEEPFQELKALLPTGDLLTAEQYRAMIDGQVKPFLDVHKTSPHRNEVRNILKELEAEALKVEDGAKKIGGEWIEAADWNKDAVENDARVELQKIKDLAEKRAYRQALIAYDELEEKFPGTAAVEEGRETIQEVLETYGRIVDNAAEKAGEKLQARKDAIKRMPARDASRAKKALDRELAQQESRLQAARDERQRWLPVNELDERTLKRVSRTIEGAARKLSRPSSTRNNVGEAYREVWAAASVGDEKQVDRLLSRMRRFKLDDKYEDLIRAQLAANPAKPEVKEEPVVVTKPVVEPEPKKKKKPRKPSMDDEDEELEEEGGSPIVPILLVVLVLGLIGFIVASKKKKDDDE